MRKRVKVQLPNLLLDGIDCFISVPVLKVHVMTTYFKPLIYRAVDMLRSPESKIARDKK
jgi:uncharacterized protein (DUF362 family)